MQVRPARTVLENPEYSRITDPEMKVLMQAAVNEVYRLLCQRENDPEEFGRRQALADRYTHHWDDPVPKT